MAVATELRKFYWDILKGEISADEIVEKFKKSDLKETSFHPVIALVKTHRLFLCPGLAFVMSKKCF